MSHLIRIAFIVPAALLLVACEREKRRFPEPSDGQVQASVSRMSSLQPGQLLPAGASEIAGNTPPQYKQKYRDNAYAVAQGKRLFRWYNCSGCHANGGGDSGPALMDGKWIYGSQPADIYHTIARGRPNGMPSFAGHIPEGQIWQIVAYVESISGQVRADVAPGRSDTIFPVEPEMRREAQPTRPDDRRAEPR